MLTVTADKMTALVMKGELLYSYGTCTLWPFLVPHSNTEQHKNSFFVHTTTDWNHLNDNQVKAPMLENFKQRIVTQNTIWFACAHSPPITFISKVGSGDISHQDQDAFPVTTDTSSSVLLYIHRDCTDF